MDIITLTPSYPEGRIHRYEEGHFAVLLKLRKLIPPQLLNSPVESVDGVLTNSK